MTLLLPFGSRGNPEPLFYTPRNPARDTLGPDIIKCLERCAPTPLSPMPWQRDVADIIGELDPATGNYWYKTIIIIVPRQAGKTTFIRGKLSHRALTTPAAQMLYTAQDRQSAVKRLKKTIHYPLSKSELARYLGKPSWQIGSEVVPFRNDSELRVISLSKTAGHGDTLDEAHIDEAFAHKDFRIEQNVSPTMITVKNSQKFIWSAMGGPESTFLLSKRDKGRAVAQMADPTSRICYIEYSLPIDADPDDPANYLLCHPAIGWTIDLEDVISERRELEAEEFERAYLGWVPQPKAPEGAIKMSLWAANYVDPDADTWMGRPVWCIDVSPDRTWSSIGLAARSFDPSARCFLECVDHEEGTHWLVQRLKYLRMKFGGNIVVIDGSSASGSLQEDLENEGFDVKVLTPNEKMDACGQLYDDVVQERVKYLEDPVLSGALRNAAKMKAAQGEAWVFSRGRSLMDITPVYSVALARYAFVRWHKDDYDVLETIA